MKKTAFWILLGCVFLFIILRLVDHFLFGIADFVIRILGVCMLVSLIWYVYTMKKSK